MKIKTLTALGIDPAATTGLAIVLWEKGIWSLVRSKTIKGDFHIIVKGTAEEARDILFLTEQAFIIACEQPPYVNNLKIYGALREIVGGLKVLFPNLILINVQTAKAAVGAGQSKASVLRAVNHLLQCHLTDHNEADAAAVAVAAIKMKLGNRAAKPAKPRKP